MGELYLRFLKHARFRSTARATEIRQHHIRQENPRRTHPECDSIVATSIRDMAMELRPIRNRREHQSALKEAEKLWNAVEGSPKANRLEVLALLIEAYEREHFPIPDPDPIDFLRHVMESRELTRKDLEKYIGSRARVAEVLNRVRPLMLDMIRKLAAGLSLPADVLIRGYKLKGAA